MYRIPYLMYHLKPCVMSIHTVEYAAYNLNNIGSKIKNINQGFFINKAVFFISLFHECGSSKIWGRREEKK